MHALAGDGAFGGVAGTYLLSASYISRSQFVWTDEFARGGDLNAKQ
jgi:hypothetical protein